MSETTPTTIESLKLAASQENYKLTSQTMKGYEEIYDLSIQAGKRLAQKNQLSESESARIAEVLFDRFADDQREQHKQQNIVTAVESLMQLVQNNRRM